MKFRLFLRILDEYDRIWDVFQNFLFEENINID